MSIIGDEFRIDGQTIANLETVGDSIQIVVDVKSALTGVLADGTPFAFARLRFRQYVLGNKIDVEEGSDSLRLVPCRSSLRRVRCRTEFVGGKF